MAGFPWKHREIRELSSSEKRYRGTDLWLIVTPSDRMWELMWELSEVRVNFNTFNTSASVANERFPVADLLVSSCCTAEKSNPAGEHYEPRLSAYILGIPTIVLAEVSVSLFT